MKPRQSKQESRPATAPVKGAETTMTFGSVTVKVIRPSAIVVQQNIKDGQAALMRAKTALVKPGVKITRSKGKPLYFGSSERPDVIIREVDGIRTVGKFVSGRFRALKDTTQPQAVKKVLKPTDKAAKRP